MTTTVKIDAHCGMDNEIRVKVYDDRKLQVVQASVLQDGESQSYYVYDNLVINVKEAQKTKEINGK